MNDLMSLGIHRVWKDLLLWKMHPLPGTQLLDVAGGTGKIKFGVLEYHLASSTEIIISFLIGTKYLIYHHTEVGN
jgi:ubiquinone/menaquinone biosynthesis C-methylase UbiE